MKRLFFAMVIALGLFLAATACAEETSVWTIWNDMPVSENAADYDFSKSKDGADFKPHIVPYMLEDQAASKGNILVCSGGGDALRNNEHEGVPTCELFNRAGFNTFLLNYRVQPYETIDMTLDVQRAVRYLKYNGKALGISNPDRIATVGFSAGAMHCYAQALAFAGDVLPSEIYPDYVCDDVDAVSADVIAVACFSAAGMTHDTLGNAVDVAEPVMLPEEDDPKRTEALPAFFFSGVTKHFASGFCVEAYQTLKSLTDCALHMQSGAPHPFDKDEEYPEAMLIREQLTTFMEARFAALDAE